MENINIGAEPKDNSRLQTARRNARFRAEQDGRNKYTNNNSNNANSANSAYNNANNNANSANNAYNSANNANNANKISNNSNGANSTNNFANNANNNTRNAGNVYANNNKNNGADKRDINRGNNMRKNNNNNAVSMNQTAEDSSLGMLDESEREVVLSNDELDSFDSDTATTTNVVQDLSVHKAHKSNALKVIFLGGVGEIGKNMTALEYGDDIIIIDCGLAFPSEEMPGIDLVIPDFTYLRQNKDKIRGVVITHGHEDHIGSLPYFLKEFKVPIYGSKLSLTLIENKIREHRIQGVKGVVVKPRNVVTLGKFQVEFIKVNHSIAGAMALSITTPVGVVFHTGDFKIDFEPIDHEMIDLPRIAEIGRKGVLLLMCESTNIERPGYTESEKTIGVKLERIFQENATRRIFVATFASNIYRIQQIIDCAIKHDRKVAVVGRSMINNIDAGQRIGEFHFPNDVFIDIEKAGHYDDKNVLILSTGSQGEPMSALSRLARGDFNKITVGENDTVIFSSSPIPGNENMVNKVINNLYRKGAIVIHEDVHTSGHACAEEIKTIHSLISPKFFIPVHGEYRHLKEHILLTQKLGMDEHSMLIPEIGTVVEVTAKTMVEAGKVPAGEMLVDGLGIGDMGSVVLRERKLLSEDGLIITVVGISGASGIVSSDPYVITRGFVYQGEAEELNSETKQILLDTMKLMDLKDVKDWNEVRNQIRKPLRNYFFKKYKRTPMILPIIYKI